MNTTTTISISNQKGGVGKTTTAVHLTQALALLGHKVLLIDMDPQANATMNAGLRHFSLNVSVTNVLTEKDFPIEKAIFKGGASGFDILPANISLADFAEGFSSRAQAQMLLKEKLATVQGQYEYIVIDTPPSCWSLLFYMSVQAASRVIVPVDCAPFALDGIKALLGRINQVKETTNESLTILGFLLTMSDRTNIANVINEAIKDAFSESVFSTRIRRATKLKEVSSSGGTIYHYDPKSPAAEDYMSLTKEVILRTRALNLQQSTTTAPLKLISGGML